MIEALNDGGVNKSGLNHRVNKNRGWKSGLTPFPIYKYFKLCKYALSNAYTILVQSV